MTKYLFIPQHLAVRSMRDNGYKNTAYALAELIDNSHQAIEKVRATDKSHHGLIEVFVTEARVVVEQRERWRLQEIAVFDNGCGMAAETLQAALQFGNGAHLDDREGIGRFGMGLPNSTVSQCSRADVWSWQNGIKKSICTHLDLKAIESEAVEEVPKPIKKSVPAKWLALSHNANATSGTLVVWSLLDRVNWHGAKATLENTEFLIGRIYRKLIQKGLVIRLAAVRDDAIVFDQPARANDPLYLMSPTNVPAPFATKPMFRPWGKDGKQIFEIKLRGKKHKVEVLLSWATDEARRTEDGIDPGKKPYGQHAGKNVGVSVVRAGRELVLDDTWATRDLRERWWGAEISFPPALDEVFGVTNNKQFANHFTEMIRYFRDDEKTDEWADMRQEWKEEDDPRVHLVDICNYLNTQLQQIRSQLRQQAAGRRSKSKQRHDERVEAAATKKFDERAQDHPTEQDRAVSPKTTQDALESDLVNDKRYAKRDAREKALEVIHGGFKVVFVKKSNDESTAFFSPDLLPGVTEIVFNTAHPAYEMLIEMLDPDLEGGDEAELRQRLQNASVTLKMLLCAWARYEIEEKEGPRREKVKEVRREWGKMARAFLDDLDVQPVDDEER
jgi:hypothetical protein